MITHLARLLILILAVGCLCSEDDKVSASAQKTIDALNAELSGSDFSKKKSALRSVSGLSSKGAEGDASLAAMIAAVSDRQVGDTAIELLRSRTGLTPPSRRGGSPGWPGYPVTDDGAGWSAWLEAKRKDDERTKQLKKLTDVPVAATAAAPAPVATTELPQEKKADTPPDDLGRIDRIIFKAGGTLLCYIRSKRLDADGTMISMRVVHLDSRGEEVLEADLIDRIEEDIK